MEFFAKIATSLDGKIALEDGQSKWISCEESRKYVHQLRSKADIIATGIGTILADDAQLSARDGDDLYPNQPQIVVFDSNARTPINAKVLQNKNKPTIILHGENAHDYRLEKLKKAGAIVKNIDLNQDGEINIVEAYKALSTMGAKSIMLEAGSILLSNCIAAGIINRLYWFRAPIIMGNKAKDVFNGLNPESLDKAKRLRLLEIKKIGTDILEIYEV